MLGLLLQQRQPQCLLSRLVFCAYLTVTPTTAVAAKSFKRCHPHSSVGIRLNIVNQTIRRTSVENNDVAVGERSINHVLSHLSLNGTHVCVAHQHLRARGDPSAVFVGAPCALE